MSKKISVCMAAYNGGKYIADQIRSILAELRESDELVIVNDGSVDDTLTIIREFCASDSRVKVWTNDSNEGLLSSFQTALRHCNGDILFLSDQDDLWLEGKVRLVLDIFERARDVTLVLSDARIIDANGNMISESFFRQRGKFRGGIVATLLKNKYLGCAIAFRRSMLDAILPLPNDIPMHDIWIGLVNAFYGKSYFIDRPLIAYRRHGGNVSPGRHRGIVQMIKWRWRLVKNLAWLIIRRAKAESVVGRGG